MSGFLQSKSVLNVLQKQIHNLPNGQSKKIFSLIFLFLAYSFDSSFQGHTQVFNFRVMRENLKWQNHIKAHTIKGLKADTLNLNAFTHQVCILFDHYSP